MIVGYARVSKEEQNLNLQLDDLKKAGCERIYKEKKSAIKERTSFDAMIEKIKEGDTLIVWKLDRLGRSISQLIYLLDYFTKKNISLISIKDGIELRSNTIVGKIFYVIIALFAEIERDYIVLRTNAGLKSAVARGVRLGRPPGLSPKAIIKANKVRELYESKMSINDIIKSVDISRKTMYTYLKFNNIELRKK